MAEHSDLAEVRARVERGGARKYHEAAAKSGKLFARERIALLIDEGSFAEDGRYANVLADGPNRQQSCGTRPDSRTWL